MTTVTLPREVVQQALDEATQYQGPQRRNPYNARLIEALRAALDAPANHPCQMCKHYAPGDESNDGICLTSNCTDFNKFQALPPVVLTKVTK